jgi:hypothetical protein
MAMIKRAFLISFSMLLLALPLTAWSANVPAKIFESGKNNTPIAVSGAKVEVLGGYGFKALLSSTESGSDGGCLLRNVPLGKEVLVRLTKSGYVTQYDVRSYSDANVENGVLLWMGSQENIAGLYANLGETFDPKNGHVYLDISDEMTGEGIEGVQLVASSGKVFDLGNGEYLFANAEGSSLKIGIQKPGYAFDIESATIPLFSGAMTQYYVKVQTGGAVYESGQASAVTSTFISGFIKRLSDAVPLSGVSVAFTTIRNETVRPSATSDATGFYRQDGFQVYRIVKVTPTKAPWRFRPSILGFRLVFTRPAGAMADFSAY